MGGITEAKSMNRCVEALKAQSEFCFANREVSFGRYLYPMMGTVGISSPPYPWGNLARAIDKNG